MRPRLPTTYLTLLLLAAISLLALVACENGNDTSVAIEPPSLTPRDTKVQSLVVDGAAGAAFDESGRADGFTEERVVVVSEDRSRRADADGVDIVSAGDDGAIDLSVDEPDAQVDAGTGAVANRVIVRNATMSIEAADADGALQDISEIATRLGGWTVSSSQATGESRSTIDIRVPAERFDSAIDAIGRVAAKVLGTNVRSTDFTQEYTDLSARISVLEETIAGLRELLRAETARSDIAGILEVQREIASQQVLLETARGRYRFITESSAYSLISVTVSQLPQAMRIQIDGERTVPRDASTSFSVRFWPPAGHDAFVITWDFGDGTGAQRTDRAFRPVDDTTAYESAPVYGYFGDPDRERYVGRVTVEARAEGTLARATSDFAIVVSDLPELALFIEIGNRLPLAINKRMEVRASFDHPAGVRDLRYEWRFGDGAATQSGVVAPGQTTLTATHEYTRYVPWQQEVVLTLTGDSDAGAVVASASQLVQLEEDPSLDESTWAPREAAVDAVNLLTAAVGTAGNVLIYVGITSPIWLIFVGLIALIVLVSRRNVRRAAMSAQATASGSASAGADADADGTASDEPGGDSGDDDTARKR